MDMQTNTSDQTYLEKGLPQFLQESLNQFVLGEQKHKQGNYYQFDCDYCALQSDINVAEISGLISVEQAWYLRTKYLQIEKLSIISQNEETNDLEYN